MIKQAERIELILHSAIDKVAKVAVSIAKSVVTLLCLGASVSYRAGIKAREIFDAHNAAIDEAIEIMRDFEIEISNEVKHRQFTKDIKYRMSEIVRFIHNEDLSKVAQSRIDGINYDLNEYLNSLTDN